MDKVVSAMRALRMPKTTERHVRQYFEYIWVRHRVCRLSSNGHLAVNNLIPLHASRARVDHEVNLLEPPCSQDHAGFKFIQSLPPQLRARVCCIVHEQAQPRAPQCQETRARSREPRFTGEGYDKYAKFESVRDHQQASRPPCTCSLTMCLG